MVTKDLQTKILKILCMPRKTIEKNNFHIDIYFLDAHKISTHLLIMYWVPLIASAPCYDSPTKEGNHTEAYRLFGETE